MKANAEQYDMTPADPNHDLMEIAQITSDAFANGEYIDEISRQYIGNCHYDWSTSRLVWDGEKLIHHWGVWGYPMRIESVQLKTAGVGAVVTLEPYRKQGLMQRAAMDSLRAMQNNGYDISILRGRHYVKFGYARAWNYVTYRLKLHEIPEINLKQPYELIGPDYMKAIENMYNNEYQDFSGTCVRPTYRMLDADGMLAYGWFNNGGHLSGYVRAVSTEDNKTLQCLEAAGDPVQGMAVLRDLLKKGEYEFLTFFTLPHQHSLLRRLRSGACIVENQYFHNTGWRVKIINLMSILGKIHPLFDERLRNSVYSNWSGSLHLDAGDQKATLHIENGQVRFIDSAPGQHNIRGGADIARFLIGSDDADEIIQQADIICTGDAASLAGVLFPNLYPVMSHWDEF